MASPFHQSQIRFHRPPITWAVQRLILLNVAVFALQLLVEPIAQFFVQDRIDSTPFLFHWFGFRPGAFMGGFLWQGLSYQFLHGGLLHLFLNMLWLYIFGPEVERTLGTRQFYRFYLFCGLLGVLATFYSYFVHAQDTIVVGASGAIMGVLVAYAMVDPEREFFLFPLPFPVNARALVIIVIFMNIVMSLGEDSNVSVATHFGGMLSGFVYMKLRPKFTSWQLERRKRRLRKPNKSGMDDDASDTIDKDKIADAVNNIFKFKDRE